MVERPFRVIENNDFITPTCSDPGRRLNLKRLLSLTPIERDVYDLHIMNSYTVDEVGETIGCSSRTVSRIQTRCTDKLTGGASRRERNLRRSLSR